MKVTTQRLTLFLSLLSYARCATSRYLVSEEGQQLPRTTATDTRPPAPPVLDQSGNSKKRKWSYGSSRADLSQSAVEHKRDGYTVEERQDAGDRIQDQPGTRGSASGSSCGDLPCQVSPVSASPSSPSTSMKALKRHDLAHFSAGRSGPETTPATEAFSSPERFRLTLRNPPRAGEVSPNIHDPAGQRDTTKGYFFARRSSDFSGASSSAPSGEAAPGSAPNRNPHYNPESVNELLSVSTGHLPLNPQTRAPIAVGCSRRPSAEAPHSPTNAGTSHPASTVSAYVPVRTLGADRSNKQRHNRRPSNASAEEVTQLREAAGQLLVSPADTRAQQAALREAVQARQRSSVGRHGRREETPEWIESTIGKVFPRGKPVSTLNANGDSAYVINEGYLGAGNFGVVIKVALSDGGRYAAKVAYGQICLKQGMRADELNAAISSVRRQMAEAVQQELRARDMLLAKGYTLTRLADNFGIPVCKMILKLPEDRETHVRYGSHLFLLSREIMLLPLLVGATLANLVQPNPSVPLQQAVARQTILALAKFHELGVAHGDVKRSNIILDIHGRAHLIDMGNVKVLSSCVSNDDTVYMPIFSPELAKSQQVPQQPCVNRGPLDVWAMGVTLFQFICDGKLPYGISDAPTAYRERMSYLSQIRLADFSARVCPGADPAVMGIALQFLHPDPLQRPVLEQFVKSYAFFQQSARTTLQT
ncbi:unnamed protein product [Neospora caninum Liverpool]|uniref:Rhoptry kinase family protein ROP16, putative n=1 Tax=Neospora caninum (strain Liverpool) TaxID=572307 RepID=F0VG79_NEOCL|nr:uncharacterized protein NCLIV_025120 [Neospora caninum Liverpool]CBZ52723.1 unnamed protein product [Neospora caninum Liverpool]CEL66704.1 TPA: Rhoptry kinase family protein ROP16, putative [Neospora caninum Liverpool]|eukprot:XP_003882755.1 uncharacterized protein NCLIV_025120 [Neospora caninum Liverpool]